MSFASPIWLALLLPPWVAVAVWLLWSRRGRRTDVPFLALWQGGGEDSPREQRAFRPPPLALVAAMTAALLAILASARPRVAAGAAGEGPLVTIILDRGVTMSVGERLTDVIEAARPAVLETFGDGPTDLVEVPGGEARRVSRSDWATLASRATPTQEQTADAVAAAVTQALARTDGPVVVLSDQAAPQSPRVVWIAPANALQNVAIARFSVRERPRPQAMVTVANFSPLERATLRVRSGERTLVERAIDLPRGGGAGAQASFFLDLPALDATAVAELDVADDIALDNVAHAKRRRAFPSIEIRAAVPPEVRRVADAYAKARPAGEGSRIVAVVTDDAIPRDLPVAVVSRAASTHGAGAVEVAAHAVSAGVDWSDAKAQAAGVPPGQGWREVVTVGEHPAVAVRETPHRQVWVGLEVPDFARTPEFVVFWTNVFDWLAGGDEGADAGDAADVGDAADAAHHWSTSLVPPVRVALPPPAQDWRADLAALEPAHRGRRDVASIVLLASVICLVMAALAWPGRSLTPLSVPLTV